MKRGLTIAELKDISSAFSIKAEDDTLLNDSSLETLEDIYVFIETYDDMLKNGTCLAIGRKGSGKSALLTAYKRFNNNYIAKSEITFDNFPLGTIATLIKETEISNNHQLVALFTELWKKAILLSAIDNVVPKILTDLKLQLTDSDKEKLEKISSSLQILKNNDSDNGTLFYFIFIFRIAIKKFEEYLNMDDSASILATPLALALNYALKKIKTSKIDNIDLEDAAITISNILKNKKNFLLTFDKYDDFIDTELHELKKEQTQINYFNDDLVMQSLLKSLMLSAKEIKNNDKYTWIHLLITIPIDKYIELQFREQLAMGRHLTFLRWSPLDLYKFVNFRMGLILNVNKSERLGIWYDLFPKEIANQLYTNRLEDSFLYLVRHSMWRPREILLYIQSVIDECISILENKKYRNTMVFSPAEWTQVFNIAIQKTSIKLITEEFLPEYQVQYPKIYNVLNTIKHHSSSKTILPYHKWKNILSKTALSDNIKNSEEIMKRLYKMGFFGLRLVAPSHIVPTEFKPIIVQYNENYSYEFGLYEIMQNPFSSDVDVVINPMFYDYLQLEHNEKDKSKEIIPCQLTWQSMNINITKLSGVSYSS